MKVQGHQVYLNLFLILAVVLPILTFGEFQVQRRQSMQIDLQDREAMLLQGRSPARSGLR